MRQAPGRRRSARRAIRLMNGADWLSAATRVYKTQNGADVGDMLMSLIATARINGADPFDYLTEMQRHAKEVAADPGAWMPWNYRETIARLARVPVVRPPAAAASPPPPRPPAPPA